MPDKLALQRPRYENSKPSHIPYSSEHFSKVIPTYPNLKFFFAFFRDFETIFQPESSNSTYVWNWNFRIEKLLSRKKF